MAPKEAKKENLTADDNLKLCLSILKHLSGKINWTSVAADLDVVSAAAAAKRYDRLLKKFNIEKNKNIAGANKKDDVEDPGDSAAGDADDTSPPTQAPPQKRKRGSGPSSNTPAGKSAKSSGKGATGGKGRNAKKGKTEVTVTNEDDGDAAASDDDGDEQAAADDGEVAIGAKRVKSESRDAAEGGAKGGGSGDGVTIVGDHDGMED